MKHSLFIAIAAVTIISISCQKDEVLSPNSSTNSLSLSTDVEKYSSGFWWGANYTFYINSQTMEYDCYPLPKDCFDQIIVTPTGSYGTDLDNAIASGDQTEVAKFFKGPKKSYFPTLKGQNLAKLVSGQLTLSRYQVGNEVMYFACDPSHLAMINTNKDGSVANKEQVVDCTAFVLRVLIQE